MRLIFSFGLLFYVSSAFACTDFTGDYRTEVYTYYSLAQNGCESIDIIDESGSHQLVFDGVERLHDEYDIVVDEQVLSHVQIYLKSEMKDNSFVYHERDVMTSSKGEVDVLKKWAQVSFNEDTDLLTELHNDDGTVETYVDVRNR